ncbi:HigA family addiction module antitoxin [Geminocystis sp. GBBB08]|uniref:HigA family addiction module antitoxin n=1 Tax=Geminocystis sp. GBBB08 TaxID=2604140 RepID=UPI0027E3A724|nr:HigA family addiction module antitoxin [Geminocystis sp. GBBB08]MBL1209885.1 HigA family addiction module antidote protein [Geminocystis sp. GBBB08]
MRRQKEQNLTKDRSEKPVHPGEVIADILEDLKISQIQFAEILGVSHQIVNDLNQEKQPITVDLAIRIGKAFGNGHQLWLNLQQKVDVWDAWKSSQVEYDRVLTVV